MLAEKSCTAGYGYDNTMDLWYDCNMQVMSSHVRLAVWQLFIQLIEIILKQFAFVEIYPATSFAVFNKLIFI